MDRDNIVETLNEIGAKNILPQGSNVQCSCFLAEWRRGHSSLVDSRPSMGISVDEYGQSLIHCFACEFGGTFAYALQELDRLGLNDFTKLLQRVKEIEEIDPEWLANSIPDFDEPVDKYIERIVPESEISHMMNRTHKYALERGLTTDTLRAWQSGYDREQRRIVFPIRKKNRMLIGLVGRAVNWPRQKPKYFNYFEFDKGRYLFGEHMVKEGTKLILTEGLLDAPMIWQALRTADRLDEYSVVASMGAKVTKNQQKRLVALADELIVFLDNDTAGWEGRRKLAGNIQKKVLLKTVEYPNPVGGDAAELMAEGVDIVKLIDNASLFVVEETWKK